MIFACSAERRRTVLRANPGLGWNGIDFLEVMDEEGMPDAERQRQLTLHFIHPVDFSLGKADLVISGGERVRSIAIAADPVLQDDRTFAIEVDRRGDFSTYTLRFASDRVPTNVDPRLAEVAFSFKAGCPNPFDCLQEETCPPQALAQPPIDYLAKDYASFRRLMLDRMALLLPEWRERNPADVGIALVELLAYVADHLSYEQDALATEAYLGTARRRVSVRRHARLLDDSVDDGQNARAWVQVRVDQDALAVAGASVLPAGTVFLTRVAGQPARVAPASPALAEMLRSGGEVFESLHPVEALYVDHNELRFYTWGGDRCCLAAGATHATLLGAHPHLAQGQVLVLVEVRGAVTGAEADADPARRHAVRLTEVIAASDPLGGAMAGGGPVALPVTEIAWDEGDALPYPFCLTTTGADGATVEDVTIALGNIVLVDHGRTISGEDLGEAPAATLAPVRTVNGRGPCADPPSPPLPARYVPRLREGPVTHTARVHVSGTGGGAGGEAGFDANGPAAAWLAPANALALPSVTLRDERGTVWTPRRDLLRSGPAATEFVPEVEDDGRVAIRFGDDRFGKRPETGARFTATYRVGNGRAGNVGIEAIGHVVTRDPAILAVANPLPASGGREPERLIDVRQRAPFAFRRQERAVTAADYAAVAERHPAVQRAVATLRWTGSWRTVFLTIDRRGGLPIDAAFEHELRLYLERFRLAGHDVEIDAPRFVPLEIDLFVCVAPDARPSAVRAALDDLFSGRALPDGQRGLFHPDNVTFGQSIHLSRLYAATLATPGVAQAQFTKFQRWPDPATSALDSGTLAIGRLEVATLENSPNFPDRGRFTLELEAMA